MFSLIQFRRNSKEIIGILESHSKGQHSNLARHATLSYAVHLRRATLSYTERHEATKCYAVLRLSTQCRAIKGVCLATPDPRSKTYASRAIAARRSAIKGVCLATPAPRSKTYASRAIAARRSAIKGVCLATPGPQSKTDALAASL